jgi:CoA:oxalate CoA-transferase
MSERRILEGVRVLDFTRVVAGPFCTRALADLGADVVRIDAIPRGDGPQRAAGSPENNLGKRSIALDLKHETGVEAARALARSADVVVENFRPGVMASLGLGYEQLSAANERLIFASISGFGQDNSHSHRRAFGATAHAEAGWLWVQQQALGGDAPFAPGVTVADLATASFATSAILAALYDRERTGRGQAVDVSLMDGQLAILNAVAAPALAGRPPEDWTPFRHPIHAARDGHVTINIGSPRNFARIAAAIGDAQAEMPRDAAEANALVGSWVAEHSVDELAAAMDREGAPYGIVKTMHEAVAHPYFAERGMIVEVPDRLDGTLRAVDSPLFLSEAASTAAGPAPLAGEHTSELLREAGYDDAAIDALLASGVAAEASRPPGPSG